jgi:RNA polymerase sigma factor (sigma-70 family)
MNKERYKNLEEFKEDLEENGLKALDNVYIDYKEEFLHFSRKFGLLDEDLHDVYQDTIIAFYENILSGRLTELTSSLKTYIFSIGKYSIYNNLKKKGKTVALDKEYLESLDLVAIDSHFEHTEKSVKVKKALEKLGDRCQRILVLFYYHSYTIEALKNELEYKNENVVRSHKSRCLKHLKDLIKEL